MAFAVPSRAKILNLLETLAIGAAGGALFLWLNLPGGLISGAMISVGIAAIAGRPLAVPPILTQSVLVAESLQILSPSAIDPLVILAHGWVEVDFRFADVEKAQRITFGLLPRFGGREHVVR